MRTQMSLHAQVHPTQAEDMSIMIHFISFSSSWERQPESGGNGPNLAEPGIGPRSFCPLLFPLRVCHISNRWMERMDGDWSTSSQTKQAVMFCCSIHRGGSAGQSRNRFESIDCKKAVLPIIEPLKKSWFKGRMNRSEKAEGIKMLESNEIRIWRGDIHGREGQNKEKKWHRYLKWKDEYHGSGWQFSS
jgi:hypothetical protein